MISPSGTVPGTSPGKPRDRGSGRRRFRVPSSKTRRLLCRWNFPVLVRRSPALFFMTRRGSQTSSPASDAGYKTSEELRAQRPSGQPVVLLSPVTR